MDTKLSILLVFLSQCLLILCYKKLQPSSTGEPLFLTPYINRGAIEEGQRAAFVETLFHNNNNENKLQNYAGFLTINKEYNSNLYFWFFKAENDKNAPIIVWLHGGPGVSSIYGLFNHNGIYYLNKSNQLMKRIHYWSKEFNVIYLDNPVGTGFTFTDNDNGYSKNDTEIGKNLLIALEQFFQLFPEYLKNDFYISGSSYAGKFIPALGYTIAQSKTSRINLKGLIIGNGFFEVPVLLLPRISLLYSIGLIDYNTRYDLEKIANQMISLIDNGKNLEAFGLFQNTLKPLFVEKTGYTSTFNFLNYKYQDDYGNLITFLDQPEIRKKIHVGNLTFDTNPKVWMYLQNDFYTSVKPWIEYLIERYKILFYTGNLDFEIPYTSITNFLRSLKWSGAVDYEKAERKVWRVDDDIAGYITTTGKLTEALVRNAGHSPSIDKPKYVYNLVKDFINSNN